MLRVASRLVARASSPSLPPLPRQLPRSSPALSARSARSFASGGGTEFYNLDVGKADTSGTVKGEIVDHAVNLQVRQRRQRRQPGAPNSAKSPVANSIPTPPPLRRRRAPATASRCRTS